MTASSCEPRATSCVSYSPLEERGNWFGKYRTKTIFIF